ncbi:MAG: Undecaprenyl-diphosphatase [Thermoanaerobacterales bacterium 50_218]|nr:MAG: Undecaprenyl-diphosphatase [Thermoanaerobacterales bacterium 50_218]HAA89303.1 undecaprenyl-diphosphatase UppP [Peptococcaceae bacterium]
MNVWQAVVLGLVQGLGEFLPISSSAHLVLVPWLFQWHDPGLTFDVALHLGTLVAVVAYFWRDWVELLVAAVKEPHSLQARLFWYLVVASIPGAAIGYLFEDWAETVFRNPVLIAVMLIIMGLVLYSADRQGVKKKGIDQVNFWQSLIIGFSQALAIIPGVSRSGITISAGLFTGFRRESAARFSFLLSVPIIFGAGLVKFPEVISNPGMLTLPFITGIVVSALSGAASISFLLKYVQTKDYLPFVWYRFFLGALVLLVSLFRVLGINSW